VLRALDRIVETALTLVAIALVATAGGQVVARYVLGRPMSWVLELDVLLLVWLTMLAGYVGVRRNAHMAVDFVVARWSERARRRAAIVSVLLSLAFVLLLGWKSLAVVDAMDGIGFASLPIGQPWMYWSLPVGAALMAIALAADLAARWRA
jgi:TRAP-type C4-dicarboxylate transport system permease small subunit